MKAITLYQPYASLVQFGWKEVETRDWYTPYRGPLAIHSAKRFTDAEKSDLSRIMESCEIPIDFITKMAFGCVIATCQLAACVRVNQNGISVPEKCRALKPSFVPRHGWLIEHGMGNYEPGRWAWILRDLEPLESPIVARGYRKLWDWTLPLATRPLPTGYAGPPQ